MKHTVTRLLLALVLLMLPIVSAEAQQTNGRIAGTVTSQDGQPIAGAYVTVIGTRHGAMTDSKGNFSIGNVTTGTYTLKVTHISYKEAMVTEVAVQAAGEARVAPSLVAAPIGITEMVVSASRQAQKVTDAPATVTRLSAEVISNSVGNSFAGALKEVKGIDFIQVGVTSAGINARGFNSSFNNRMLMVEDGRIAVLPENGLPVGGFTTIPKLDLESVEVLIGPGAALYGADASNGVVTLTTKNPRDYPGMSFEASGGNRSYMDLQGRIAGVIGKWGYKVTGEHQSADDFSNEMRYGVTAANPAGRVETGVGGKVDWTSRVSRGNASAFYYMGEAQIEATVGMSISDGVGQTNVGRNQLDDWKYNVAQLKYTSPHWYASVYRTQSQAGKSYALNRFTDNKAANPSATDDQLRLMSDWPSDGQMYAAELQTNWAVPQLNSKVVFGAQFRNDIVSSDRQWLTDRLTGEDLSVSQKGVYGQLDVQLHRMLNLVTAARYDDHENYDAQFSPKVGVVFKPIEGHAARVTYNRAFKSPTTLQTNFFIPDFAPVIAGHMVGVHGNTRGFIVRDGAGATIATYAPLSPEENTTWEVGYKAAIADRLFVDVAGYRAKYDNFMSPLATIANSLLGQTAYFADNDERIDTPTARQLVLTYFNIGQAKLDGVDAGVKYLINKNVDVNATFSQTELAALDTAGNATAAQKAEATALNSPVTKWTVGAQGRNIFRNFGAGFTGRHVTGYRFRSGINNNWIPTFNTVDLNFSYAVPALRSQVNAAIVNAYTCRSDYTFGTGAQAMEIQSSERKCGFDTGHQEMVNMPRIGTMFFLGVRYNR